MLGAEGLVGVCWLCCEEEEIGGCTEGSQCCEELPVGTQREKVGKFCCKTYACYHLQLLELEPSIN